MAQPLRLFSVGCSRPLAERALALGAELFVVHRESKLKPLLGLGLRRMLVWDFDADDGDIDLLEQLHRERPFHGVCRQAAHARLLNNPRAAQNFGAPVAPGEASTDFMLGLRKNF